jgi:hypothetical protein
LVVALVRGCSQLTLDGGAGVRQLTGRVALARLPLVLARALDEAFRGGERVLELARALQRRPLLLPPLVVWPVCF